MTDSERQTWQQVRARGRESFLLGRIRQALWLLPCAALVEFGWWLVTREPIEPFWKLCVKWLLMVLFIGSFGGMVEWNTREREYEDSK